ncbi:hypothetical protein ABPG77_001241 [Micractinium sp. CCAP 211/92]
MQGSTLFQHLCGRPAGLCSGLRSAGRPVRRGFIRASSFQEQQPGRKKSVEELAAQQGFGTEPGGELGRQDPGPRLGGAGGESRELAVDAALRSALRPLLAATRAHLRERPGDAGPGAVAEAAVAAAEASGALPPLAGAQRAAVLAFFTKLAEDLGEGAGRDAAYEPFGSSGGEEGFGPEDAALRVRPHTRELLEQVVNWHLDSHGSYRCSCGPSNSAEAGGEVGNIALQSDTHHTKPVRGVPAESGSDRAERQAEAQFEQLELADLPHATAEDVADQREWARHPENRWASAAIEGDAPAAGDGLQVVSSDAESRQLSGNQDLSTAADQVNQAEGS